MAVDGYDTQWLWDTHPNNPNAINVPPTISPIDTILKSEASFNLPPHKTEFSTAEAVYAKASTIDGNIEAITLLLDQSGIVKEGVFEKYVILIHGDLGTMEKINGILSLQQIVRDQQRPWTLCQLHICAWEVCW
ncbi:uncharacterized protein EI90DRAFT_3124496 [Cantharellus anzutake]|uniref:uncharacterized protein n=1 Tax=Cantharellus anzutake TaxID=1750568 RepID=UPI0019083175|nr:uncharacterized protein EI90DRAFT_3124496 [Cantharellus anzutake]KAF8330406.1 hypothetical protein EI90DRAFT_3124496 [Cantharellus anzutake]